MIRITEDWILQKFGPKSSLFHQFFKFFSDNSGKVQSKQTEKYIQNWKEIFPTSLGNLKSGENILYRFLCFQYLAWALMRLAKRFFKNVSIPEKFSSLFPWISWINNHSPEIISKLDNEFEKITSPIESFKNLNQDDLFGDFLNQILTKSVQEEKGMFFTPKYLSDFIVKKLLNGSKKLGNLKIFEPTCGTGNFLLSCFEYIAKSDLSPSDKSAQYHLLYAVDENPVAILATWLNLINNASHAGESLQSLDKIADNLFVFDILSLYKSKYQNFPESFDIILGNLPWNVYNHIPYPNVKKQIDNIGKSYDLFMTWKNRSNLEIATIIFTLIQKNCGKIGTKFGVLLPTSIITATQHSKFRRFDDLDNIQADIITPDIFPIHAMTFYAEITNSDIAKEDQDRPIKVRNIKWIQKQKTLSNHWEIQETNNFVPAYNGTHRNSKMVGKYIPLQNNSVRTLSIQKSQYFSQVFRGVDITPRRLLCVNIRNENGNKKVNINNSKDNDIITIESDLSASISTQGAKWNFVPYESAQVEKSSLHPFIKSMNIAPFKVIGNELAFIPLVINENHWNLPNIDKMLEFSQKHYQKLENIYQTHQKTSIKNNTLRASLEYGKKMQNPAMLAPLKVVYPVGGSYSKAAIFRNPKILIDVTLYYLTPESENEAYYLLAWLNSSLLHENLPRVCTIGANGSIRVIHLGPWMFPLPKFDWKNALHQKITDMGRMLEKSSNTLYDSHFDEKIKKKKYSNRKFYRNLKQDPQICNLSHELDKLLLDLFS
ncbi:MAG: N-6 DNA methylase [Promethearchaeota archaeon]